MEGARKELVAFFVGGHKVVNNEIGRILLKLGFNSDRIIGLESFEKSFIECHVSDESPEFVLFIDPTLIEKFEKLEDDHPLKAPINRVVIMDFCYPINEEGSEDFRRLKGVARKIGTYGFIPLPVNANECKKIIQNVLR